MYENKFSHWRLWAYRDEAPDVEYPGVYALAYSTRNIAGKSFSWRKEIIKAVSGWERVLTKGKDMEKYKNERGFEIIAADLGIPYPGTEDV